MIAGYKPKPGQTIQILMDGDGSNNIDTIQQLGWCLLSYDKKRFRRVMKALEHTGMHPQAFIAQAVESYMFSIEHAACFPELLDHLTRPDGRN